MGVARLAVVCAMVEAAFDACVPQPFAERFKPVVPRTMAAPDINTEEGRKELVKAFDPDFQGLLEKKEVNQMLQARLSLLGVKSISKYAVLVEDGAALRTFAVDHCAMDRNRDVVQIAGLLDAFEASKTRMQVRHKAEAEASSANLPPPVNKTEAQDLRVRFEQMHYKLEDKVSPSTSCLEQVFEQVEGGEWRNLSLVHFTSREDQDAEPLTAVLDKSGALKVRKGSVETKPPGSPEELRVKLRLVAHTYIMTQLKFPNREVLRGVNPVVWNRYADYLLGEHCHQLKAKGPGGETMCTLL